ncbi:hypothetical protein OQA88_13359 [Cercophora sp. LCS_1]
MAEIASQVDNKSVSGNTGETPRTLKLLHPASDTPTVLEETNFEYIQAYPIVAIHGLDGDSTKTWTNPGGEYMWIRDALKEEYPRARIFAFEYDVGCVFFKDDFGRVGEVASAFLNLLRGELEKNSNMTINTKRPIVFICHCLGGIILKAALIKASDRRGDFGEILELPKGAVFMGTPYTDRVGLGELLKYPVPETVVRSKDHGLLMSHSQNLLELCKRFVQHAAEFKQIVTIYEELPHPSTGSVIVDDRSATMQLTNENAFSLKADHSSICKFESAENPNFKQVTTELRRMIRKTLGVKADRVDSSTTGGNHAALVDKDAL